MTRYLIEILDRAKTTEIVLGECRYHVQGGIKKKYRHLFADLMYKVYECNEAKELRYIGFLLRRDDVHLLQKALDSLQLKSTFGWLEDQPCGRIYKTPKADLLAVL
jgi:hypothetical protein